MVGSRGAMMVAIWLVALASASGCAGGVGDSCTSSDGCGGELFCRGPDEPNVCGIPPREDCGSSADCGPGSFCHAIYDTCSADEQGSECGPACSAGTCNPGFRCNSDQACEAIPCDEADVCTPTQLCDPTFAAGTPVHAVTSGCQAAACEGTDDCEAGFCVNGRCQSSEGSCREVELVP